LQGWAVSKDVTIMNATDTITVVEGYDAMRIFFETVSLRLGKNDEEIDFIVGGLKWADGAPVDPTMWQDWLAAVQIICSCRTG
jgi:hypothetical protein